MFAAASRVRSPRLHIVALNRGFVLFQVEDNVQTTVELIVTDADNVTSPLAMRVQALPSSMNPKAAI